ncbi:lipopolysaccharide assembly protein LapB [Glaciecola sp. KUL10]|uniref:tetratricopeptide repeat protein n=1 Tax=Glaciecola sp. (strain KUL10) TaxID=2161813 RepID=UPI000D7828BE|nr:hypothetical protein [Glaciecola sp. KUL10]GBL03610.1 hypothetical protein KUL10_09100 [Glaciecola sp. KUL10]
MESNKSSASTQIDEVLQANADKRTLLFKRVLLFFAGILVIGVLVILIWQFSTSNNNQDSANVATPVAAENAPSKQALEAARTQFMQGMAMYEQTIAPLLSDERLIKFDRVSMQKAQALQNQALNSFASGGFIEGKASLEESIATVKQVEANWLDAVNTQLLDANRYFTEDQIDRARLSLNQALTLDPINQDALSLQTRIEAFLPVQDAIRAFNIAKTENNLSKQISALQQIVALDPNRSEYQAELNNLQEKQKDKQVATLVSRAYSSLESRDFVAANTHLSDLKRIEPSHSSIKEITSQLRAFNAQQEQTRVVNTVKNLFAEQQFSDVLTQGQIALATFPSNIELQRLVKQARDIQQVENALDGYIANPIRLQDTNIRVSAKETLKKAVSVITKSNDVAAKAKTLSDLLTQASALITVTVLSDNQTDIRVLGVGNVGKTVSKQIELSPGDYVFEGRREGFKSKQVKLNISTKQATSITVVCDERI